MKSLRIAIAVLAFAAQCVAAGTVEQRSPFVQGHWWNPDRSGSGLEIFNSGDQTMVIWYTYDSAGKPVWYTAQGATSTIGSGAWLLQKHRWANGRKADADNVGTLKLSFSSVQSGAIDFTVEGASGRWPIQPFVATSMMGDVDHSGSWFDPTNSGWGLTVIQQADVLGGALFTYDAAGNATWVSGFGRGTNVIEYGLYSGSCPTCAYQPFTAQSVGHLTFDFKDEYHATVKSSLALAMAPGVGVDGANVMQFSRPMSFRAVDRELASFSDDFALRAFLQEGMLNASAPPSPAGFSAGGGGATPYSTTNLQEQGVDEADLVKTTASAIYTFGYDSYGYYPKALRVYPVGGLGLSVGPPVTVPLAAVEAGEDTVLGTKAGLYADDTQVVAITSTQPYIGGFATPSPWGMSGVWATQRTSVEIFDVTGATAASKWTARIDGALIASRRVGDRLYLVTRWSPAVPSGFAYFPAAGSAAEQKNRDLVANMSLADLSPVIRVNSGIGTRAVQAGSLFVPPQGQRKRSADTVLVTAIDLSRREIAQTLAIAGAIENVYVSQQNLYLMSSRYDLRGPNGVIATFDPYGAATDIHQVSLAATGMSIVASGSVDGTVGVDQERAAFQVSEYDGKLRVVSQASAMFGALSRNRVTILEKAVTTAGTVLKSVSYIPNARQPEPIGKPGEFLYSTRFVGDRLYAVTFKSIDPLYVIDLSNAAAPRVAGALEMPGFAQYLHPLENGLLLGFGKEAVPSAGAGDGQFAWYQGLMLALYDVTDPARIRELDRAVVGKRGSTSAALNDHHAFTTLRQVNGNTMVAFPASINTGALTMPDPSYFYPWAASGLVRYEVRGTTPQTAVLAAMQSLFTHTAENRPTPALVDPAGSTGRAALYPNSTFYLGSGQLWRLDAFGKASGPF
jgi:uncharacterized secreted protein with C-terminal beta-propeller domain